MELNELAPNKLAVPMRMSTRAASGGLSHDQLLDLALAAAGNAEVLRDHDPYIGSAISSSNSVDSHFTFMDEATTLPRFVEDQKSGDVVILDSHNSHANGFGRAIWGELETDGDKKLTRTWWYTPRNMRTSSGMNTDDYILGMETGIYRDVSVGFYRVDHTSIAECTICNEDMFGWNCPHWPGGRYLVNADPKDEKSPKEERVALGRLINWGNSELSYVYKGSNRDAKHDGVRETLHLDEAKVRMYVDAGELTYNEGVKLQRMYDFEIPDLGKLRSVHASAQIPPAKQETTAQETDDMEWTDNIRTAYETAFGEKPSVDIEAMEVGAAFRAAADAKVAGMVSTDDHTAIVTERDALKAEVDTLKPLAKTGETAMTNARKLAKAETIRANAAIKVKKGLSEEQLDRLFGAMDLDDLIAYTEAQSEVANNALGDGGRKHRESVNVYAMDESGDDNEESKYRNVDPSNFRT